MEHPPAEDETLLDALSAPLDQANLAWLQEQAQQLNGAPVRRDVSAPKNAPAATHRPQARPAATRPRQMARQDDDETADSASANSEEAQNFDIGHELARVMQCWPNLSVEIRSAILAVVRASSA